jgi:hypothetical protein
VVVFVGVLIVRFNRSEAPLYRRTNDHFLALVFFNPHRYNGNMTESKTYIYGITDEHGTVRYVGKSVNVERRFSEHFKERDRNYPLYTWIRKQQRETRFVGCAVLVSVLGVDWQSVEKAVIKQYREDGFKLLNLAGGGDEPFMTREQRRANGSRITCPLSVRQANGRVVSAAIQSEPKKAKLHKLKLFMCLEWSRGNLPPAVKNKLVSAAFTSPKSLGCFIQQAVQHG